MLQVSQTSQRTDGPTTHAKHPKTTASDFTRAEPTHLWHKLNKKFFHWKNSNFTKPTYFQCSAFFRVIYQVNESTPYIQPNKHQGDRWSSGWAPIQKLPVNKANTQRCITWCKEHYTPGWWKKNTTLRFDGFGFLELTGCLQLAVSDMVLYL